MAQSIIFQFLLYNLFKWAITRPLFLYFRHFYKQLTVNNYSIKTCHPRATDKNVLQLSVWVLVRNFQLQIGKNIPASFTDSSQVRFDRSKFNAIAKAKKLFVSETCLRFCAIDLQISFQLWQLHPKKYPKPSVKLAQSGCDLLQSVKLAPKNTKQSTVSICQHVHDRIRTLNLSRLDAGTMLSLFLFLSICFSFLIIRFELVRTESVSVMQLQKKFLFRSK